VCKEQSVPNIIDVKPWMKTGKRGTLCRYPEASCASQEWRRTLTCAPAAVAAVIQPRSIKLLRSSKKITSFKGIILWPGTPQRLAHPSGMHACACATQNGLPPILLCAARPCLFKISKSKGKVGAIAWGGNADLELENIVHVALPMWHRRLGACSSSGQASERGARRVLFNNQRTIS
jgi:hypothetical protein